MSGLVQPTFFVIGAMKAGTTSLAEGLRLHPQVFLPAVKEPEFFSEERNWQRGPGWYSSLFEPGADLPVRGEASTGYSQVERFPDAPARMAALVPDARLVYVLRDPIERMRSHYRHSVLMGRERRPVDDALPSGGSYLDASCYARQLRAHLEHFDRSQVLTIFSDDLATDVRGTLRTVAAFIGAEPDLVPEVSSLDHHVSEQRRRLPGPLAGTASWAPVLELRRRSPAAARALGRMIGRRGAGVDDRPSEATRQLLRRQLHDDLEDLRSLVGPLPTSWDAGP